MLKAVIFDMDGVLIDSEPLHARAAVLACGKLGIPVTVEYCYGFIGSTTRHMLDTIKKDYHLDDTLSELLIRYDKAKEELIEKEGHIPIPFTRELILDLHRHGIRLAIASSSSVEEIDDVVEFLGFKPYFHKLVSGTTVSHPKPAPDVFLKAASELGVDAGECIIIEDSFNGVCAGNAAGIPVIGFINKNSGNQDLSKACILIEGFEEIDYDFVNKAYLRANNLPLTIAETRHLVLRELTPEDIPALHKIRTKPEVAKYLDVTMDFLETEIEKQKAYIKNIYHFYGYGLWGVFLKETNELIGQCGIQNTSVGGNDSVGNNASARDNASLRDTEEFELGYLIDSSCWGHGYGKECTQAVLDLAFHHFSMDRIVSVIHSGNLPSLSVAEELHMVKEREFIKNGEIYYLYSIVNPYMNTDPGVL